MNVAGRGLADCSNATASLDPIKLTEAAARTCDVEVADLDNELTDICVEGSLDECDGIRDDLIVQVCFFAALSAEVTMEVGDSCTEKELESAFELLNIPQELNLEMLADLGECDGDVKHVCLTGDDALDLDEISEDGANIAEGIEPSDEVVATVEDSAAGLVAFAGVSLAAAAMLA